MANINLAPRVRDSLYSLQDTQSLLDLTNRRLSTGLKVETAVDDPVAYFRAQSLTNRADAFTARKSEITQGIDALKTTTHGLSSLISFARSIKGQVAALRGADSKAQFDAYTKTFNEMLTQYDMLAKDATYNGQTFLATTASQLDVKFSADSTRKLSIKGIDETGDSIGFTKAGAVVSTAISALVAKATYNVTSHAVSNGSSLDAAIDGIDTIISKLQADAVDFGGKLSILNIRSDFTEKYTQDLEVGASDLVMSDSQLEGAHMLSLRTRQSLALNSLSIASAQDRNVLQLING